MCAAAQEDFAKRTYERTVAYGERDHNRGRARWRLFTLWGRGPDWISGGQRKAARMPGGMCPGMGRRCKAATSWRESFGEEEEEDESFGRWWALWDSNPGPTD